MSLGQSSDVMASTRPFEVMSDSGSTNSSEGQEYGIVRQLWLSPVPDWKVAMPVWGPAWPFHQYFFAAVFYALFLAACVLLWRAILQQLESHSPPTGMQRRRSSRALPPPVLCLVATASLTRAVSLTVDAYHSKERLPVYVARTLGNLPFSCLLAALQLIYLVLRRLMEVRINTINLLEKWQVLAVIVIGFIVFNTAADIVLALVVQSRILLLLCMAVNIAWMITIVVEYVVIALRIHQHLTKWCSLQAMKLNSRTSASDETISCMVVTPRHSQPGEAIEPLGPASGNDQGQLTGYHAWLNRFARKSLSLTSSNQSMTLQKAPQHKPLMRIFKAMVWLAVCTSLHLVIFVYYFLGTAGAVSLQYLILPWPWYASATLNRLVEATLIIAILIAISPASRRKNSPAPPQDRPRSFWQQCQSLIPRWRSRKRKPSECPVNTHVTRPENATCSTSDEALPHWPNTREKKVVKLSSV